MTRQEAKEHFWCDTDKFGESVARKFGNVNYNKIFTGYYIGSEIDKFIDKIYDDFEERKQTSSKDKENKYFIISYMFGKQSFGTGTLGYICDIYPNLEQLTKEVNVDNFTVTNIIEVTKKEYQVFFQKE